MEFDTLILLLAAGYALLQWMLRGVRKASGQSGEGVEPPDTTVEQAEVEVRRRDRLERLRERRRERIEARQRKAAPPGARSVPPPKTRQERQVEEFQRTLEQLLGVRTGPEYGPLGRQSGVELEPAEDVEDLESLEEEPDVVSLETGGERAQRQIFDQDTDAEALVQRRIAAGQARSGALTKADHSRFDQKIRAAPEPIQVHRAKRARQPKASGSIREALIWSEILGPPVARR